MDKTYTREGKEKQGTSKYEIEISASNTVRKSANSLKQALGKLRRAQGSVSVVFGLGTPAAREIFSGPAQQVREEIRAYLEENPTA